MLIIVLWVAFGLCSIALYFAHSMSMEYHAADNEVASMEADQAIEGAALYVSNVLATLMVSNAVPSAANYRAENVKIGNGTFWLIGRDTNDLQASAQADHPFWGLVDEASKLNLNTASLAMLQNLPQMTLNPDIAAAMYDWQSTSATPSTGGAKTETYSALNPPYDCKNGPYETTGELRLVYGMNLDYLYGEDANLNGILDPNENDGDRTPPNDNQDGILDPGILEYVTVFTTGEGTVGSNGIPRVAINSGTLMTFIQTNFPQIYSKLPSSMTSPAATSGALGGRSVPGGAGRVAAPGAAAAATTYTSVLQFYVATGLAASDFEQIEPYLMNPSTVGLINVNTASATVLSCIPGIGTTLAPQVLTYRQSNPPQVPTITWLPAALGNNQSIIAEVGTNITAFTYHYTADVAAVGHYGRGYRRVRFVFDTSSGTPLIVYRQDLTYLGWALGKKLHDQLLSQNTQ